jgi:hypothetical protein
MYTQSPQTCGGGLAQVGCGSNVVSLLDYSALCLLTPLLADSLLLVFISSVVPWLQPGPFCTLQNVLLLLLLLLFWLFYAVCNFPCSF